MITHVVAVTFAAENPEQRAADAEEYRRRLAALRGQIPELLTLDIGLDLGVIDGHYELGLVTTHATYADLEAYQAHPLHQEALAYGKTVVAARAVVDFES